MSKKTNYATLKTDDLYKACSEREIKIELEDNTVLGRQEMIKLLMEYDEKYRNTDGSTTEEPKRKLIKVVFHSTKETDTAYQFLGLNGKGMYIPREEPVWIPEEMLEAARLAVETRVVHTHEDGKMVQRVRHIPAAPYSILEG